MQILNTVQVQYDNKTNNCCMYENLNNGLIFKETIVFLNLNHRPLMNSIMYYRRTD